ncbi:hypothetical protein LO772_26430 [Yinghuangia sp. ASG 101]|uniref:hypothetical protein n=1 Tax=Yinghuangia sp. ASG 101 TaxID=2896848 RepID=UPI001E60DB08|nr:hypothetical protein [Yinghuangia sp. ASG 101]UGQ10371.1 hypothetical protein LO772_26430 [Yinghuangia sp. ASG 101]
MGFTTGDLVVDLPELDVFARRLDLIRQTMNDTPKNVDNVDAALGHSGAADALHDFADGWRDGRKKLEGEMKALSEMGHSVVTELTATDQKLANAVNANQTSP